MVKPLTVAISSRYALDGQARRQAAARAGWPGCARSSAARSVPSGCGRSRSARSQGWRRLIGALVPGDLLELLPPSRRVGVGDLALADDLVDDQVEQAVLAADVPVQGRGAGAEFLGERRMLSAARPSRSRSRIAAATIASRLIGSRRRRAGRSGSRCQGGGGICTPGSGARGSSVAGRARRHRTCSRTRSLDSNTVPDSNSSFDSIDRSMIERCSRTNLVRGVGR